MKNKSAFTLIEISIVTVIIGILIVGVLQSSSIIRSSKLSAARALTDKSPVLNIDNLMLWYESTATTSFASNEAIDNATVSTWYDLNTQNTTKNNATASGSAKPTYITNCINSIPCLRFNGSSNYLSYNGNGLVGNNYAIFIVGQRNSSQSQSYFMGGSSINANQNLHCGFRDNSTITQAHYSNDMDYTTSSYSTPTPQIHNFFFSSASGKKYWLNSAANSPTASSSQTVALISYTGSTIGSYASYYYLNGDIAEIIIYSRAITTQERKDVMNYLAKKYNITISS